MRTLEDRFMSFVMPVPWSGCWIWTGALFKKRYGMIQMPNGDNGKATSAHRVSYEMHKGPIPDGLFIDHICRMTMCVNPAHLRAVTPKVNCRENNSSVCAINAAKTHCKRGHEFTFENIIPVKHGRACLECRRLLARERYHGKR